MSIEEAELRRAREALDAVAPGSAEGECPDAAQIWQGALGRLPQREVVMMLDHSLGCAPCEQLFRLAREMAAEADRRAAAPAGAEGAPARPRLPLSRRRSWAYRMATAGAVAAAVSLVAVPLLRKRPPPGSALRSAAVEPLRSLTPPSLSRQLFVLRWSAGPRGTRYTLHVARRDLTPLYRRTGLELPEHVVPATAFAGVPTGGDVLWRVEAALPDGQRLSSAAFLARIE